jgi:hypothetical protein
MTRLDRALDALAELAADHEGPLVVGEMGDLLVIRCDACDSPVWSDAKG